MGQDNYRDIPRLRVNAGGEIDAAEVIGRHREIKFLLRTLDQQSVLVAAERRIGKTTICKQAMKQMSPYALGLYTDIEKVGTTAELVSVIIQLVMPHLGNINQLQRKGSRLYSRFQGQAITLPDWAGGGGFSLPKSLFDSWKETLSDAISDLIKEQTTGANAKRYVCLFLDEFPIALEKIRATEGDRVAMDVLDLFRSLRSTNGKTLRFVFTGSIGIHHIVKRLQKAGHANRPLNDVYTQRVTPLTPADARILALGLLLGEEIAAPNYEIATTCIATESSCIPFYIHHVVSALWRDGLEATEVNISAIVRQCIESPDNPWDMKNYVERLERHFPETRLVALALLDALAVSPNPLSIPALIERVRLVKQIQNTEDEVIIDTLDMLEQDFYIGHTPEEHTYYFLRPLLQQAWRHLRKLSSV